MTLNEFIMSFANIRESKSESKNPREKIIEEILDDCILTEHQLKNYRFGKCFTPPLVQAHINRIAIREKKIKPGEALDFPIDEKSKTKRPLNGIQSCNTKSAS